MEQKSPYFRSLSVESQKRYEEQIVTAGLKTDPYTMEAQLWTEEPEVIPDVNWSDMMLYMINTSSPYTKEEMKVGLCILFN